MAQQGTSSSIGNETWKSPQKIGQPSEERDNPIGEDVSIKAVSWLPWEEKLLSYLNIVKGAGPYASISDFFPRHPNVRSIRARAERMRKTKELFSNSTLKAFDVFRVVRMHEKGSSWTQISSELKRSADDCEKIWNDEKEYKVKTDGSWLSPVWIGKVTTLIDLDIYEVYKSVPRKQRSDIVELLLPYTRTDPEETLLTTKELLKKFVDVDVLVKDNERIVKADGHLPSQKDSHVKFGWEETNHIIHLMQTEELEAEKIAIRLGRSPTIFSIQYAQNRCAWEKEVEERQFGYQSSRALHDREWEREEELVLRHWHSKNMPLSEMSALLNHAVDEAKVSAIMNARPWDDETELFPWKKQEEDELLKLRKDGYTFEYIACHISRTYGGLFRCTVATMYQYDKLKKHEVGHSWKPENNRDNDPNTGGWSSSDIPAHPRPESNDSRILQVPGGVQKKEKGARPKGPKFPNMPIRQTEHSNSNPEWEPYMATDLYLDPDYRDSGDEKQPPIAESSKTHKRGASTQISSPASQAGSSSDQQTGSPTKQPAKKKAFSFNLSKKGKEKGKDKA